MGGPFKRPQRHEDTGERKAVVGVLSLSPISARSWMKDVLQSSAGSIFFLRFGRS